MTFYYEPSSYGMLAENFALYMSGGQSAMFLAFHVAAIVPPIIFYTFVYLLCLNILISSAGPSCTCFTAKRLQLLLRTQVQILIILRRGDSFHSTVRLSVQINAAVYYQLDSVRRGPARHNLRNWRRQMGRLDRDVSILL